MKANCHPYDKVSQETTGGASIDPTEDPALKMPTPRARCFGENHSETALVAAGQLPGSPSPSMNRHIPNVSTLVAKACSIDASDHAKINSENPFFVPIRSTM